MNGNTTVAHGPACGGLSRADRVSHLVIHGLLQDLEAMTRERDAFREALHVALHVLHHAHTGAGVHE